MNIDIINFINSIYDFIKSLIDILENIVPLINNSFIDYNLNYDLNNLLEVLKSVKLGGVL